ncbi:dynactin subunit 6-like [Styela clava]
MPEADKLLKIAPDTVVCVNAEIKGDVTIGSKTIIHPKARICAQDGPIIIGEGNLIEEQSLIINKNIPGETEGQPLIIGNYNVFEVGSVCETKAVGDNNIIESKAKVGPYTKLTNGCVIGALCEVNTNEILPENTLICGEDYLRRRLNEHPQPQHQQLDYLRKILPNYHYLQKSPKKSTS